MNFKKTLSALSETEKSCYDRLHALYILSKRITLHQSKDSKAILDYLYDQRLANTKTEGILWWKKNIFVVSSRGITEIDKETRTLLSIRESAVKELKAKNLGSDKTKIKKEFRAILEAQDINIKEFIIKKKILLDGAFDYAEIGVFSRSPHVLEDRVNRSKGSVQDQEVVYEDDFDFLTWFLIMDFMSDGRLDFNFTHEPLMDEPVEEPMVEPTPPEMVDEAIEEETTMEDESDIESDSDDEDKFRGATEDSGSSESSYDSDDSGGFDSGGSDE